MTKTYLLFHSETSEFLQMKYRDFVEHCAGRLIVSIGRGKFQEEVEIIMRMAMDWGIYCQKNNK